MSRVLIYAFSCRISHTFENDCSWQAWFWPAFFHWLTRLFIVAADLLKPLVCFWLRVSCVMWLDRFSLFLKTFIECFIAYFYCWLNNEQLSVRSVLQAVDNVWKKEGFLMQSMCWRFWPVSFVYSIFVTRRLSGSLNSSPALSLSLLF